MERRVKRRLKQAKLKLTAACLEDVDYTSRRGLDRKVIEDLATCHWIRNGRNVVLTGATGVGKTWLACALSNRACREGSVSAITGCLASPTSSRPASSGARK
jgi:DNA replication protein DnaC